MNIPQFMDDQEDATIAYMHELDRMTALIRYNEHVSKTALLDHAQKLGKENARLDRAARYYQGLFWLTSCILTPIVLMLLWGWLFS